MIFHVNVMFSLSISKALREKYLPGRIKKISKKIDEISRKRTKDVEVGFHDRFGKSSFLTIIDAKKLRKVRNFYNFF